MQIEIDQIKNIASKIIFTEGGKLFSYSKPGVNR